MSFENEEDNPMENSDAKDMSVSICKTTTSNILDKLEKSSPEMFTSESKDNKKYGEESNQDSRQKGENMIESVNPLPEESTGLNEMGSGVEQRGDAYESCSGGNHANFLLRLTIEEGFETNCFNYLQQDENNDREDDKSQTNEEAEVNGENSLECIEMKASRIKISKLEEDSSYDNGEILISSPNRSNFDLSENEDDIKKDTDFPDHDTGFLNNYEDGLLFIEEMSETSFSAEEYLQAAQKGRKKYLEVERLSLEKPFTEENTTSEMTFSDFMNPFLPSQCEDSSSDSQQIHIIEADTDEETSEKSFTKCMSSENFTCFETLKKDKYCSTTYHDKDEAPVQKSTKIPQSATSNMLISCSGSNASNSSQMSTDESPETLSDDESRYSSGSNKRASLRVVTPDEKSTIDLAQFTQPGLDLFSNKMHTAPGNSDTYLSEEKMTPVWIDNEVGISNSLQNSDVESNSQNNQIKKFDPNDDMENAHSIVKYFSRWKKYRCWIIGVITLITFGIFLTIMLTTLLDMKNRNPLPTTIVTSKNTKELVRKILRKNFPLNLIFVPNGEGDTPQDRALRWIATEWLPNDVEKSTLYNEFEIVQIYSLLTLFLSTDGEQWHQNSGWMNVSLRECNWFGVTCMNKKNGNSIAKLNLSNNNLKGTLPPEITMLHLSTLVLKGNHLFGSLPASIGKLNRLLSLDLSNNNIAGSLPDDLGNLSALTTLNLSENNLTSSIPEKIGMLSLLRSMYLGRNNIVGFIPTQIGSMVDMSELELYDNILSGPLPSEIGLLSNSLERMSLQKNQFHGPLPTEIGSLKYLRVLDIAYNRVSGKIPVDSWKYTLPNFEHLDMANNLLTGTLAKDFGESLGKLTKLCLAHNFLTGPLPSAGDLWKLSSIKELDISFNFFEGGVPNEMSRLTKLEKLDLSENYFDEFIDDLSLKLAHSSDYSDEVLPEWMLELKMINLLNLRGNNFSGRLGSSIGSLSKLKSFSLSGLQGIVPTEIGLISSLESLTLSNTELEGFLPVELFSLTNLTRLDLSNNNLINGSITSELGNLKQLQYFDISNRRSCGKISGSIPSEIGFLTGISQLQLEGNSLSSSIPSEIGLLKQVKDISLQFNSLVGVIPSEVGLLNQLRELLLENNDLVGSIPTEIGLSSSIEILGLDRNKLSGSIPIELGNLSLVKYLDLKGNKLTGSIPSEIGILSYIEDLNLRANIMTGAIPSEIGLLSQMKTFILDSNEDIVGSIPTEIGLLKRIEILKLHSNKLAGSLPSEIGLLYKLRKLHLHSNNLDGSLPSEIGSLNQIKELSLNSNSNIAGSLPSEIGMLKEIEALHLHSNKLESSIPSEIGLLNELKIFDLYLNELSGSIPSQIGLMNNIEILSLYSNGISGSIPSEIGLLNKLKTLNLEYNSLTGYIPTEIGLIHSMEVLIIHTNDNIRGTIPLELRSLSQIHTLRLHSNRLTGSIPSEIGLWNQIEILHLNSNELTGSIPSEMGILNELKALHINSNALTGSIPSEIGMLQNIKTLYLYWNELVGSIPFRLCNVSQSIFVDEDIICECCVELD